MKNLNTEQTHEIIFASKENALAIAAKNIIEALSLTDEEIEL